MSTFEPRIAGRSMQWAVSKPGLEQCAVFHSSLFPEGGLGWAVLPSQQPRLAWFA